MENEVVLVKVGVVPGTVKEFAVEDTGMTIREIFEQADIQIGSGYSVRVNGVVKNLDDEIGDVSNGTTLLASKMIKGN